VSKVGAEKPAEATLIGETVPQTDVPAMGASKPDWKQGETHSKDEVAALLG
jgi:hypothetical protein